MIHSKFDVVINILLDQKNKKQNEAMDPINALQNLASQGTRNPMPMMNMGNTMGMTNTNANANVLQNLIHVSIHYSMICFS